MIQFSTDTGEGGDSVIRNSSEVVFLLIIESRRCLHSCFKEYVNVLENEQRWSWNTTNKELTVVNLGLDLQRFICRQIKLCRFTVVFLILSCLNLIVNIIF